MILWLLIGYMFLYVHRPFEVWPTLGTFRIELLYMLVTGALWLGTAGKRWIPNPLHLAYFGFAAAVLLCWVASPWTEQGLLTVDSYLKILVFYVLIVTVVHDEESLRKLVFGLLCAMSLYMLHSLWEYHNGRHNFRMGIPRLIGVDDTNGDPNAFGATVVYALPLVLPFWMTRPSGWLRCFLIGYVALSTVCVGLTGSRSAFVGLVLAAVCVILRSRWRWRLAALALLASPVLWLALPPSLQNRFETIINPDAGPANAQASAQSRVVGLQLGLQLWANNPLTGCGPGAWRKATRSKLESHNLYGQVLGETGSLGALGLIAIVGLYWWNVRRVKQLYRANPEWAPDFACELARALGLALLLLLFLGNFGHNLFRYTWLWYGGFLIVTRFCVEQRLNWTPLADRHRHANRPIIYEGRFEWIGTHA